MVKANIGGSGAGIVRYDTPDDLARAAEDRLDLGVDHTALVQEYVPARGGHITRVETLGGQVPLRDQGVHPRRDFNLCPADICQRATASSWRARACPIDAPKSGLKVEGYSRRRKSIEAVERIVQAAAIDVGGIEYMIDDRDGRLDYYDVNALSNFVADAEKSSASTRSPDGSCRLTSITAGRTSAADAWP